VLGLTRYSAKGVPGETVQNALFIANQGMDGDFHAIGGKRQLGLLSTEERQWMDAQSEDDTLGLCFGRYKENVLFDANPLSGLVPGSRLAVGEAVLEISDITKHCFAQCPLFSKGRDCILAGRNFFAKVVQSGFVRIGDCAKPEPELEPKTKKEKP